MPDCMFCKIAAHEMSSDIVYEDEALVAFRDINPQAPMHVLVIPRTHIDTLNDLTAEHDALVGRMYRTAQRIAADEGYAESGYRTVVNCGAGAGQSVFHVHLHMLAGRRFGWPPG
ncbi:MAG: histidine triad nucleotide-binding protein [Gammaproteobacteria bacterium]|nr:histidine triad nucleotide-binding protein [Gammaproteobacteria bacterium]